MHLNSKLLFSTYAKSYFQPGMRVLEIGPDRIPSTYEDTLSPMKLHWDTIDIYQSGKLTHVATGDYSFPISDNTYDIVVSANVIEHVRHIWTWMKELNRVCKPNGLVITVNPLSWPFHEAPVDCWRIYPEGMKALYEDSGLDTILSKCECLEVPASKRRLPGLSIKSQSKLRRSVFRALALFRFPQECAFDTITIGRKRV